MSCVPNRRSPTPTRFLMSFVLDFEVRFPFIVLLKGHLVFELVGHHTDLFGYSEEELSLWAFPKSFSVSFLMLSIFMQA